MLNRVLSKLFRIIIAAVIVFSVFGTMILSTYGQNIPILSNQSDVYDPAIGYQPDLRGIPSDKQRDVKLGLNPGANTGSVISMKIGSTDAMINGLPIKLDEAPFLYYGIPFVPLRNVVNLLNGSISYMPKDRSAVFNLQKRGVLDSGVSYQVWVGKTNFLFNGTGMNNIAEGVQAQNGKYYIPIIKNNRMFVPAVLFQSGHSFMRESYDPETSVTILDNFNDGMDLGGFIINEDFAVVDKEVRDQFKSTGLVNYPDPHLKAEVFTDGDVELTIRTSSDPRYLKWSDTKEEINAITIISDKYATPRGLRVGDSYDRYLALYGKNFSGFYKDVLNIETKNNIITSISIHATD